MEWGKSQRGMVVSNVGELQTFSRETLSKIEEYSDRGNGKAQDWRVRIGNQRSKKKASRNLKTLHISYIGQEHQNLSKIVVSFTPTPPEIDTKKLRVKAPDKPEKLEKSKMLELPQELSRVHHTFHVSNLKKCYADEPLVMPLEGIHVDDKLQFMEEPIEIMEREIKRLKQSRIPLVNIRWNSRRGPEFTWEREDSFKQKYP
ncbi:hypothetical protein Tco_0861590 [Tanacetum coccineum]|uniref:Reverse transcriptase domain-containing protein n=1 Tax=Tanacetum coccineum TaxID=301880 RepID=A0ABQ5BL80_9ASTR